MIAYLGPGVGVGGIITLFVVFAALFLVFYSFIALPLKRWIRNKRRKRY
jgi:hypothetical protein